MKYDGQGWQKLSEWFEGFTPQRLYTAPSEWWILWYILLRPFKGLLRLLRGNEIYLNAPKIFTVPSERSLDIDVNGLAKGCAIIPRDTNNRRSRTQPRQH